MIKVTVKRSGGKRLAKVLADAKKGGGVSGMELGFFSTAKYQDGTQVAAVAAYNEFGTSRKVAGVRRQHVPERPFFRQALEKLKPQVSEHLRRRVNPRTLRVSNKMANEVGVIGQAAVQERIEGLRTPPNAPSTIAQKGSSNPLIDEAKMRTSVTYRVGL